MKVSPVAILVLLLLLATIFQAVSPEGRRCHALGGTNYLIGGCVKITTNIQSIDTEKK